MATDPKAPTPLRLRFKRQGAVQFFHYIMQPIAWPVIECACGQWSGTVPNLTPENQRDAALVEFRKHYDHMMGEYRRTKQAMRDLRHVDEGAA